MDFSDLKHLLDQKGVDLVAVSKTKPETAIQELYNKGQRIFGENRAQELMGKQANLPKDIQWHMIGHLQKNKVKYIAPFVHLIQSCDNLSLIEKINKEAIKNERIINILLQIKIAQEESKFGYNYDLLIQDLSKIKALENIKVCGVMGMGTLTQNDETTSKEFKTLKTYFDTLKDNHFADNKDFNIVSMGMSGDYKIAIECGSTMVRIGSLLFGSRN